MSDDAADFARVDQERWLKRYYFVRAAFSTAWVVAAITAGQSSMALAAVLFVLYPAWDAGANYLDASRSGGLARNPTQAINVAASLATAIAVAIALRLSMNWVLGVFGAWAMVAGLLQLGTALRRWRSHGAQWAMILSGAQSALAGGLFIARAQGPATPSILNVAGYAGVGAAYFLISAVWLTVSGMRRKAARA